ncbi:MAG: cell division protein ZapA [Gammaproteobacteria bacterium]|nr:cell division protein ZapA [Gammaproteobacteria bacterium]|tara:strand:+ start:182 stop:493 length:312 start_codon:yes stop_codon:yes gene_type:complete
MVEGTTVTVRILDKEYQVSCQPDEVQALKKSATYVDERMREFKENSSVLGLDRLAVMVALNIANDFISETQKVESVQSTQDENLKALSGKLEQALVRFKKTAN